MTQSVQEKSSIVIVGLGAKTSVGLTLPMTATSVRAHINCFSFHDYLRDRAQGDPFVLASLETLSNDLSVFERMVSLAVAAAHEALRPWKVFLKRFSLKDPELPVIISVPPFRPGFAQEAGKKLVLDIIHQLPIRVAQSLCSLFDSGHQGGLAALQHAIHLLRERHAPVCLIGGVDSYKDIDTLHWLESLDRLKRDHQPHGFIPGEGSGFVLVCSKAFAQRYNLQPLAEIVALSQAMEPNPWYMGHATQGQGLTQTLHELFDQVVPPYPKKADVVFCDLNGESWRVDEWGYAYLRTGRYHGEPLAIRHPADCWGDVGAATSTLLLGLSTYHLCHRHNLDRTALIWSAADTRPWRAACLLQKIEGAKIQ